MDQQPEPGEQRPYQPPPAYQPYAQPYGRPDGPPYGQPPVPSPYGYPASPYGIDPVTGLPWSDKSKVAAGLLQLLLPWVGICGVGRLYTGHVAIGLSQLLGMLVGGVLVCFLVGLVIVPVIWLWTVIDGIVLLASRSTDAQGRPLR